MQKKQKISGFLGRVRVVTVVVDWLVGWLVDWWVEGGGGCFSSLHPRQAAPWRTSVRSNKTISAIQYS